MMNVNLSVKVIERSRMSVIRLNVFVSLLERMSANNRESLHHLLHHSLCLATSCRILIPSFNIVLPTLNASNAGDDSY